MDSVCLPPETKNMLAKAQRPRDIAGLLRNGKSAELKSWSLKFHETLEWFSISWDVDYRNAVDGRL